MNKKLILACLACFVISFNAFSQNCEQKFKDAEAAERRGEYLDALRKFNAARKCDAALDAKCELKIEEMFRKIDKLGKDAVIALEQIRLEQIKSAKAQGNDFRNKQQYDAALQSYNNVLKLAKPAEQQEINMLIAACEKERKENDYQKTRQRGLNIAKTGDCKAAKKYLLEAYGIKPDDPQIVEALKQCKIDF